MSPSPTLASLPHTFTTLKSRILTSLSTPSTSYTDASPKGSLDTAIIPLISRLNGLEGVVTTSSCAGRVSVFVEGRKKVRDGGGESGDDEGEQMNGKGRKGVPGGKGLGGRWLFVSHEPVPVPEVDEGEGLTTMFGLSPKGNEILHIATASLKHASPILSAAISAGFRESGIQSLKNLIDPSALPMVAVRSAGLAFESIIGVVCDEPEGSNRSRGEKVDEKPQQQEEVIEALVDEQYLKMLVQIANERFEANKNRIRRFEESLFGGRNRKEEGEWEDKETRKGRKRQEGLMKREELKADGDGQALNRNQVDEDMGIGELDGIT
ncbi:MAG: hypothetical protein Q9225_000519 [Loekoesia sp. 1 TL-2023]